VNRIGGEPAKAAKWTIGYLPRERVVEIVVSGLIDRDDWEEIIVVAADAGIRHNSRLGLVDHRRSEVALTVLDIDRLAAFQVGTGVAHGNRVAILVPESQMRTNEAQFFDDRSFNAGMARALFSDRAAAVDWLVEPTATPRPKDDR
jgi:hypothetical protein